MHSKFRAGTERTDDLDPMTFIYELDLENASIIIPELNLLGRGFLDLQHCSQTHRQTDRQTDASEDITTPHSRAVRHANTKHDYNHAA